MARPRFPSSGPLIRRAFELLGLVDALPTESMRKALQRYGHDDDPAGVSAAMRRDLVDAFTSALLGDAGTLIAPTLADFLDTWDVMAASLNSLSVWPEVDGLRAYPLVRLAVFDLAIRCAALRAIELKERPHDGVALALPEVNYVWLEPGAFERTVDAHRWCTLDDLAEQTHVSIETLSDWRSGRVKPRSENLRDLASVLTGRDKDSQPAELSLRVAVAADGLQRQLDEWFGDRLADDLRGAFRVISNRALQALLLNGPGGVAALEQIAQRGGAAAEAATTIDRLTNACTHPAVHGDLVALRGPWTERARFWLQQIGARDDLMPRLKAVGASEDDLPLVRELVLHIGDPFAPRSEAAPPPELEALRADPQFRANQLKTAGLSAFTADEPMTGLRLLTEAVRLDPENAGHQYSLGAHLGQFYGSEKVVESALEHLRIAAKLRPDWPQPVTEIGIVLSNHGRVQDATAAYDKAAPVARGWHHFHHARGVNAVLASDLAMAERSFREALRLHPSSDIARACLVLVLERSSRGKTSEARELVRLLEKRNPGRWRDAIPRFIR